MGDGRIIANGLQAAVLPGPPRCEQPGSQAFVDDWIDAKGEAREGVLVPLSVAEDVLARAIAEGERRERERVLEVTKATLRTFGADNHWPVSIADSHDGCYDCVRNEIVSEIERRINADSSKEQG